MKCDKQCKTEHSKTHECSHTECKLRKPEPVLQGYEAIYGKHDRVPLAYRATKQKGAP